MLPVLHPSMEMLSRLGRWQIAHCIWTLQSTLPLCTSTVKHTHCWEIGCTMILLEQQKSIPLISLCLFDLVTTIVELKRHTGSESKGEGNCLWGTRGASLCVISGIIGLIQVLINSMYQKWKDWIFHKLFWTKCLLSQTVATTLLFKWGDCRSSS